MPLNSLIAFLQESPSPWHVVKTARSKLTEAGFVSVELR
jgi:aspartyl aminopeptidase